MWLAVQVKPAVKATCLKNTALAVTENPRNRLASGNPSEPKKEVSLHNASDYQINRLHWTPNPNAIPLAHIGVQARRAGGAAAHQTRAKPIFFRQKLNFRAETSLQKL